MKIKTRERLCTSGVIIGAFVILFAGGGWERGTATFLQVAPLMIIGVIICGVSAVIGRCWE